MTDKEFLQWIHDRLEFVHKENHNIDYMNKLRCIIAEYNEWIVTPNISE